MLSGMAAALGALFAPAAPLIFCTAAFIAADFATGTAADCVRCRQAGRRWYFESRKAWRTVVKAATVVTAVALAWLLDSCVLGCTAPCTAKLFAGFACGVELWSFLVICAQLSATPLFRLLQRDVRRRIDREIDREIDGGSGCGSGCGSGRKEEPR